MRLSHSPLALVAALLVAGCGSSTSDTSVKPSAGALAAKPAAATSKPKPPATPADVEAAQSAPLPAGVVATRQAPTPGSINVKKTSGEPAPDTGVSPGAPSDAEIAAELKEMERVVAEAKKANASSRPTAPLKLTAKGNAETPDNAPPAVAAIIAGANAIARFPYVYGGGHGSFVDTAYDCSGSVSYALATAGLLNAPLTSGELAKWGAPGPGKWVTIYAHSGHVYMYVAGTRYDTSGRSGVYGSRWQQAVRSGAGFTVRHPPGL